MLKYTGRPLLQGVDNIKEVYKMAVVSYYEYHLLTDSVVFCMLNVSLSMFKLRFLNSVNWYRIVLPFAPVLCVYEESLCVFSCKYVNVVRARAVSHECEEVVEIFNVRLRARSFYN